MVFTIIKIQKCLDDQSLKELSFWQLQGFDFEKKKHFLGDSYISLISQMIEMMSLIKNLRSFLIEIERKECFSKCELVLRTLKPLGTRDQTRRKMSKNRKPMNSGTPLLLNIRSAVGILFSFEFASNFPHNQRVLLKKIYEVILDDGL